MKFKRCILGAVAVSTMLSAVPVFAMDNTLVENNATEAASEAATPRAHGYVVNADVLNVRSGPGTSYAIVGKLYYGDYVWLDPEADIVSGWTGIYGTNAKGQKVTGYVSSQYIDNVS